MPIKIPQDLPASDILEKEGVLLIKEHDAIRQDIRPLRILLLNLMPKKIETETQIARVLAGSPLQIEITLLAPSGHQPKKTSREHMLDFYRKWEDIKTEKFDGLIVTGAPIEQLPFEEVTYWDELCVIFDWSLKKLAIILQPFVPHISEEIWSNLCNTSLCINERWPNEKVKKKNSIKLAIQINGKTKEVIQIKF